MEFLKALFADGEALTYDQLVAKAAAAKINAVDLSKGGYVSLDKHNDKVNALTQQVEALNGQIAKRDTDLADLQTKLTAAQADASKLGEVQTAMTDLQGRYDTEKKDLEGKLARQAYEFAIRERAGSLKFSSAAAKKAFVQEAISKEFKRDGESLLGYDEFVAKYKAEDPGAFAPDTPDPAPAGDPAPAPQIVLPTDPSKGKGGDTGGFHFNFTGVRPAPTE